MMSSKTLCKIGRLVLDRFQQRVRTIAAKTETVGYYTPHETGHFSGVQESVESLLCMRQHADTEIEDGATRPISETERLVLEFCAWAHDVGMLKKVSQEYYREQFPNDSRCLRWTTDWARAQHDAASRYFVVLECDNIFEELLATIASDRVVSRLAEQEDLRSSLSDIANEDDLNNIITYIENKETHDALHAHIENLAFSINLIASFHRRRTDPDECPTNRHVLGEQIRSRLLAAIFRLGDALHVDKSRFSEQKFEMLRLHADFAPESRRHWMKSFLASSITVNPEFNCVDVQLDLPAELYANAFDQSSPIPTEHLGLDVETERRRLMIAELIDFIASDLEEDVLSVSPILLSYNFPVLLKVRCHVHPIPNMKYTDETWSALHDLSANASPNTSQFIQLALDGINEIFESKLHPTPRDEKGLLEAAEKRLASIRDQLSRRPCHQGLRKIADMLHVVVVLFGRGASTEHAVTGITKTKYITRSELLEMCIAGTWRTFCEQRKNCVTKVEQECFDSELMGYANVIVYGYSEQVIRLLKRLFSKDNSKSPRIYVLECRTKNIYTSTGRPVYLDGMRYSIALRDDISVKVQISLTPDSAIGRILSTTLDDEGKTLVLLGSNAITEDCGMVHSMGHITVAAVAKSEPYRAHTDVFVVTDSLKIGGTRSTAHQHRDWQRNADKWLTHSGTVLSLLEKRGIELFNWQEDLVPEELIDKILVLDHGESLEVTKTGSTDIRKFEFDAKKAFCDKLQARIIASRVRKIVTDDADMYRVFDEVTGGLRDLDEICFAIAEHAIGDTLPEDPSTASTASARADWARIREEAIKGTDETFRDGVIKFCNEFEAVSPFSDEWIQVTDRTIQNEVLIEAMD